MRIALNLKGLPYEMASIHLTKDGGQQRSPEFKAVNPQMRVPALKLSSGEVLTQSLAIIEYLDEINPERPLLPADALARAKVRAVCATDRLRHSSAQQSHCRCNISSARSSTSSRRSTPGIITG